MGSDSAVYKVKPETGNGKHRVVHRNLLPCNDLTLEVEHIMPKKRIVKSTPPRVGTCPDQGD